MRKCIKTYTTEVKKFSNDADAQKPTRNGGGAGYCPQVHDVYYELHLSP